MVVYTLMQMDDVKPDDVEAVSPQKAATCSVGYNTIHFFRDLKHFILNAIRSKQQVKKFQYQFSNQ